MDSIMDAVREWHEYAERDLSVSKHLLSLYPIPLEIITYHCQQCAEKYLKSYLVYNDEDIVKIHDLNKLRDLCSEFDANFSSIENQCQILTRYVTDTRYPSQKLELTDSDIKKAIEYAEEIKDFVLAAISNHSTRF